MNISKTYLFYCLTILVFFLYFFSESLAQKQLNQEPVRLYPVDLKKCVSSFNKTYIGSSDSVLVKNHLLNTLGNLKIKGNSLELLNVVESRAGIHFLFAQMYNGIKVYRGDVKVNMDKEGNILSLFDNTYSFNNITFYYNFPDSSSVKNIFSNIKSNQKYYYFISRDNCVAVRRVEYFTSDDKFMEALIGDHNTVLYSRDLNCYYSASSTDSTVSAMVFMPDPLTTAGVSYGGLYSDNGDADIAILNLQRVLVNMRVSYSNDTFRLESPYVVIKDFASPNVEPVYTVGNPSFNYTRSHPGFENVNAYYHLNTYQNYMRSLGFTNIVNYPIWVDTRGTLADNSFFSPGHLPPRLTFGIGGVDDAEDADVIIHEYGHAIAYSAAPNTNNGIERNALDEANGDYFAASYSKYLNPFSWQKVYTWDGHNEFWTGRMAESTKHYPEDRVNDIYEDADIWSSTIMQIWNDIGREEADATLIESLYSYASNMTMEDAAALYIQADALLYAGKNADVLCTHFYNRGLFSDCIINPNDGKNIHVFNTSGFGNDNGAIIRFVNEVEYAFFTLYDVTGRKLFSIQKNGGVKLYILKGDSYPNGIYLLKVETPTETASFKLIND